MLSSGSCVVVHPLWWIAPSTQYGGHCSALMLSLYVLMPGGTHGSESEGTEGRMWQCPVPLLGTLLACRGVIQNDMCVVMCPTVADVGQQYMPCLLVSRV